MGREGCEYSDIICKYLSIRSRFIKNEEYIILKNNFVSSSEFKKKL